MLGEEQESSVVDVGGGAVASKAVHAQFLAAEAATESTAAAGPAEPAGVAEPPSTLHVQRLSAEQAGRAGFAAEQAVLLRRRRGAVEQLNFD